MNQKAAQPDIRVTVKVFGGLRESFQGGTQTVDLLAQSTIGDLLQALGAHAPQLACKLQSGLEAGYLNVLVNGRNVYFLHGLDTILNDTDSVAFLPPVGGG